MTTARRWLTAAQDLWRTPRLLVAQKLLRRVPFRPVDLGKLCFLRLNGVPHVPKGMLRGGTRVRGATPNDIADMCRLQDKPQIFLERFAGGDECVVALAGDRIVGYEWFSAQPVHEESEWGLPIEIPGGFVYAYDAYIDPAHRNTGVWLRFKAFLSERMIATGKRGVLTFVDYGNWPSLRTHVRFGFVPSESVLTLKVLGVNFFRRLRAIGSTTWVWVTCLLLSKGAVVGRVLHVGGHPRVNAAAVRSLAHAIATLFR